MSAKKYKYYITCMINAISTPREEDLQKAIGLLAEIADELMLWHHELALAFREKGQAQRAIELLECVVVARVVNIEISQLSTLRCLLDIDGRGRWWIASPRQSGSLSCCMQKWLV